MSSGNPIGIFDSGVGGVTVVKTLLKQLPGESFIYFGDNAHVPYGEKSEEELFRYARQILAFLMQREVKAVVVACNTSSSITLPILEKEYELPLLGVVKAGAQAAVRTSESGRIGVLATQGTVRSRSYSAAIKKLNMDCQVFEQACPALVPLVESGCLDGPEVQAAIEGYVRPLLKRDIDTIILGCTHYPFLSPTIQALVGDKIKLVDPANETIDQVRDLLHGRNILRDSSSPACHEFYVSGQEESFFKVGRMLIGDAIHQVTRVELP